MPMRNAVMPMNGIIGRIILNKDGLYNGNLKHYLQKLSISRCANNPYHNVRHGLHVMMLCASGILFYRETGRLLHLGSARNLLIAALFHDYDHTGRSGNDDLNIQLAIRGLKEHILPEDKISYNDIATLIVGTQYPHVVHPSLVSLSGQILRDADLCQVFSTAWIQQVIFGLAAERGVSPLEILKQQKSFISGIRFETDWAKFMFGDEIQPKLEEVDELLLCYS